MAAPKPINPNILHWLELHNVYKFINNYEFVEINEVVDVKPRIIILFIINYISDVSRGKF